MRFRSDRAIAPHRIAVIGSGPRGLSIVERMGARLAAEPPRRPVEIYLIDAVEVGCGRVWRTDQPDWFLMNTVCGEVSAFSGIPDGGPARAGAGPSLVQWWESVDPDCPGPNGYAPRAVHGRYMHFVLEAVERSLPPNATLHRVHAAVETLRRDGAGYALALSNGMRIAADRVILVTGHSRQEQTGELAALADFAATRPHLRYIDGDSAADMPLDAIPPGSAVGILGLGLSFYDVMAALTLGRGGTFAEKPGGGLVYQPSGREPLLVAGSRSGMPLPARGRNQKEPLYAYKPLMFTPDRVRRHNPGRIDFKRDAVPLAAGRGRSRLLRHRPAAPPRRGRGGGVQRRGRGAAENGVPDVGAIARAFGIDLPRVDLDQIARPFTGLSFADPAAFERALIAALRLDLEHAEQGNVDSPLKAALDVLRDTRWVIRNLVDFSGLDARVARARLHRLVQPAQRVPGRRPAAHPPLADPGAGRGRRAAGGRPARAFRGRRAARPLRRVLAAGRGLRGPGRDRDRRPHSLARRAARSGPADPQALRRRGLDGLRQPPRRDGVPHRRRGGDARPVPPVGRDGAPDTGLYVLGIPTEHTRWFMQGGSSRPGRWTDFVHDADAIAGHALAAASELTTDEDMETVEPQFEALAVGGA